MPLELLTGVFGACSAPKWSDNNSAIDLVVEHKSISFETLKQLESSNVFAESLLLPSNPKIQADFNSGKPGELPPKTSFRLRLPRVVSGQVVAKNLADLLSISAATYRVPTEYFLVNNEDSGQHFCFSGQASLSKATPLIKRYHDAIALWRIIEGQAEHSVASTRQLLFFGIRKTEIAPGFSLKDLAEDIAVAEILDFAANPDRVETRKEIFRSVLSEFLQDQKPDRAFSYLLRQSALFARRLKEGLAIYLSDHSPEKLAKQAQSAYLDLADKLEKIVSGMEAKSLSIPAAVLLAVKESDFGRNWTALNVLIIVATFLYLITMLIVFLSQRAMLNVLGTTISKTIKELREQGLDEKNPILSDSFAKLQSRRAHTQIGSRLMLGFSFVPLAAVIYAVFCASPAAPPSYTLKVTPTNGIQIIQSPSSQQSQVINNNGSGTNLSPPATKH